MAVRGWLADKSALVWLEFGRMIDAARWSGRVRRGLVSISASTRLELGYSARSGQDGRRAFDAPPLSFMPVDYLTPAMENRALEV